jgi:5'-methylthioadenosine/S-adenosylhomocysteine nucleosidase
MIKTEFTGEQSTDFLIITTSGEEFEALTKTLPRSARRNLYGGESNIVIYDLPLSLPDGSASIYRIVVMQTDMGRVKAAIATNNAIRQWQPRNIILIGVAGGVPSGQVQLGDVLIADQIIDYEQQKITALGVQPRWEVYRTDAKLLNSARRMKRESWVKLIQAKRPARGTIKNHTGPIASGDKIFASRIEITKLLEHWPRLIGVEMEAGGVAAAVHTPAAPGFLVIRAVADIIDDLKHSKSDEWRNYAAAAAAAFTVGLLKSVPVQPYQRRWEQQISERKCRVRLFCSYSHRDEDLRKELEPHLKLLQRQGLIDVWFDRDIEANEDWRQQVDHNLEKADIILLLISADFIASDYCYEKEMRRALERHERGDARLIPVILRDVNLKGAPFANLQYLPKDGRPVTLWENRDTAWRSISEGIEKIAKQIQGTEDEVVPEALLIAGITLENIRCFKNLDLSFSTDAGIRKFILLFGDNGVGKTTLLRSLALGLCDEMTSAALIEMLPGTLLRENAKRGSIKVELKNQNSNKVWSIETILRRNREGAVEIEQNSPNSFPRERVFVCGYGSGRRGFGTQDYANFALKNSLGTLFNYDTSLQNPELAFRRMEAQNISIGDLTRSIDTVLMLEPGATRIDSSGIRIKGPWGDFTPLGGLGDGFQATLGWMADLFGWALFYEPNSILNGISGIVLLDEIEQHLHPSWQREIVHLLYQQFPNIQFIGTSHAPMCALGTTALPESTTEIVRLRQADNCVEATPLYVPKSQRADQVLTSPLFGLFSASGFDVAADIERYSELASKKERNDAEQLELIELEDRIEATLGPFRSDLERRIDAAVRKAMQTELEDVLKSGKLTNKTIDLKIRHRIQHFLDKGKTE